MRKKSVNNNISAEVLAAFLDGNATTQECQMIFNALSEDAELRELFHISQSVDSHFHLISQKLELLPMTALAATCEENNLCSLECEKYVLRKRHLDFDEHLLLENAIQEGWQKENGTALHNIGRNLEKAGLIVERRYKCTISDVVEALNQGDDVIAAIDGGELIKNQWCELKEDLFVGQIPDHVVVVLACNLEERIITLYDPNTPNAEDVYPIEQFVDAWKDSKNYLLTINFKEMKTYIPRPIDLSDVVLTEDLTELREAIAENAHEIWATDRQAQGWIYGPKRDEDKKETPCMLPYSQLPEEEKEFDRKMAMRTIKLLKKLGYDLIKREETELYQTLLSHIRTAKEERFCPHCVCAGKKTPIFRGYVYCNECGHKLDIVWD